MSEGDTTFQEMRPVLEFLARGCASAWLLLSELVQELDRHSANRAAEYIRRFLESKPPASQAQEAWQRLVFLNRSTGDVIGGTGLS